MKRAHCCDRQATTLHEMTADGWLLETGIGEDRAALVEKGQIVEALIVRHGGVKAGLIAPARLVKKLAGKPRAIIELDKGGEAMLSPVPASVTEGQTLNVEITREAISERHRFKLPWAKASNHDPRSAPSLRDRMIASGLPVRECGAHERDHLGEAGWHDVIEEARSGTVPFDGGSLEIAVTPAMTLIDIDGDLDAFALCSAGAKAAACTIRRLRLQGSIGIDFPGLFSKQERAQVADIFDDAMQPDCERTAINGFGFMQIIRRRTSPSLPELLQTRAMRGHALELLRRAERHAAAATGAISGGCATGLFAHPAIIGQLSGHPAWIEELSRRSGRSVMLRPNPKLAIGGGYAATIEK